MSSNTILIEVCVGLLLYFKRSD